MEDVTHGPGQDFELQLAVPRAMLCHDSVLFGLVPLSLFLFIAGIRCSLLSQVALVQVCVCCFALV